jgi:hypothetical protein
MARTFGDVVVGQQIRLISKAGPPIILASLNHQNKGESIWLMHWA